MAFSLLEKGVPNLEGGREVVSLFLTPPFLPSLSPATRCDLQQPLPLVLNKMEWATLFNFGGEEDLEASPLFVLQWGSDSGPCVC